MQVDFLPAKAMTPEELEEQQKRIAELTKKTKTVEFEVDGQPAQFELFFVSTIPTNGGVMYDVTVLYEEMETKHRIILGREYYEDFNMDPQHVVVMAFTFLLQKKESRHTEGNGFSSCRNFFILQSSCHERTQLCSSVFEAAAVNQETDASWCSNL